MCPVVSAWFNYEPVRPARAVEFPFTTSKLNLFVSMVVESFDDSGIYPGILRARGELDFWSAASEF